MAFRTQKISQMTPKGANLEATDLIEVSTIESGSYVTRSITGQEIIDAAVGNVDWGDIGGTLSNQTDLQSALDAKVPTSRTLTINGVTQDLSADRTFTISTGITIGSTAIASGVVGRVLFEGTGNVVQESGNLFWDNTNGRLGIGTSTPSNTFQVKSAAGNPIAFFSQNDLVNQGGIAIYQTQISSTAGNPLYLTATGTLFFESSGAEAGRFTSTTRNLLINTTTDAGFRLDVNGNSRVKGAGATGSTNAFTVQNSASSSALSITNGLTTIVHGDLQLENTVLYWSSGSQIRNISNGVLRITNSSNSDFTRLQFGGGTTSFPSLQRSGSALAVMDATGTALTNLLVGTTTDAGFRLDVNGTARVQGATTFNNSLTNTSGGFSHSSASPSNDAFFTLLSSNIRFYVSANGYCKTTTSIVADTNGVGSVNASAISQIDSTTKGFLPPRMTTTQKNAIASPAAGLVVYDTTLNKLCVYTTAWETVTSL